MTETTETDWPFDAYQDDPLAALRIPVVGSPHPGWRYEVALVCPNSEAGQDLYPAGRPDEAEAATIAAYIEYRMEYYNSSWRAKMRKRPLDVDDSTNTVVLWKRGDGDWCYRRDSWRSGPLVVPVRGDEPLNLDALLDRIAGEISSGMASRWRTWKAAHPGAFPHAEEAGPAAAGTETTDAR